MTPEKYEKLKRESYKNCTDEIRMLYESFIASGFTEEQAFTLTSTYVRQTMFDSVLRSNTDNMYKNIIRKRRLTHDDSIKGDKELWS